MDDEYLFKKFLKIRDELQVVARLLVDGNSVEAAYMLGCLKCVCHNAAFEIKEKMERDADSISENF